MTRLGTLFARLGGANVGVLEQARKQGQTGPSKEKARYIALGLVLIATASLAVLSMTFAMIDGLKVPSDAAILVGLGWGAVILLIDRALIINLKPKGGRWRLAGMILPRIAMAALLGAVIATPLTLRVFASEIEAEMVKMNLDKVNTNAGTVADGDLQAELDKVKEEIQHYEDILAGRFEVSTPSLEQAQAEFNAAEEDVAEKQAAYDAANLTWRCERYGELCANASGIPGDGARAEVARMQLDRASEELAAAQGVLEAKRASLLAAQEDAMTTGEQKLAEAQAEANAVLPGLRAQRDQLQAAVATWLDASNSTAMNDTGLLARLVALEHLGEQNAMARLAHLLVAALIFMIELLPVAIKTLTSLGPPNLYDQVDDLDSKQVLEDATVHRSHHRRKRKEIDDDMFQREVRIGREVNDEVERVVRGIAVAQVRQWGQDAQQAAATFARQSRTSGGRPQQPTVPTQRNGAFAALARVYKRKNLPPSSQMP